MAKPKAAVTISATDYVQAIERGDQVRDMDMRYAALPGPERTQRGVMAIEAGLEAIYMFAGIHKLVAASDDIAPDDKAAVLALTKRGYEMATISTYIRDPESNTVEGADATLRWCMPDNGW